MLKLFSSTRPKFQDYREDIQHYYDVLLIETELSDKTLNIEIQSNSRYTAHRDANKGVRKIAVPVTNSVHLEFGTLCTSYSFCPVLLKNCGTQISNLYRNT